MAAADCCPGRVYVLTPALFLIRRRNALQATFRTMRNNESAAKPKPGDAARCEVCGKRGRWVKEWPSIDDDNTLVARCSDHLPEDDYT